MPITRYWEIENGYREATDDELRSIAKVLKCDPSDIVAAKQVVA